MLVYWTVVVLDIQYRVHSFCKFFYMRILFYKYILFLLGCILIIYLLCMYIIAVSFTSDSLFDDKFWSVFAHWLSLQT